MRKQTEKKLAQSQPIKVMNEIQILLSDALRTLSFRYTNHKQVTLLPTAFRCNDLLMPLCHLSDGQLAWYGTILPQFQIKPEADKQSNYN